MKYRWHVSPCSNKAKRRLLVRLVGVVILISICIAGFLLYEQINKIDYNPEEQTTSSMVVSNEEGNVQLFESSYFQFRANNSWKKDESVSNNNVHIYRSMRANMLEQLLTIYINTSPPEIDATYVLPVSQQEYKLQVGDLSEHCGKQSNYSRQLGFITVSGVSMRCFGNDTRFNVVVGLVGGSTEMQLQRPGKESATYVVYYANSTASPNAEQLKDIMNSFTIR